MTFLYSNTYITGATSCEFITAYFTCSWCERDIGDVTPRHARANEVSGVSGCAFLYRSVAEVSLDRLSQMSRFWCCILTTFVTVSFLVGYSSASPTVNTEYGAVTGSTDWWTGVNSFRGIQRKIYFNFLN